MKLKVVTSKGQITIPIEIRKKLGIKEVGVSKRFKERRKRSFRRPLILVYRKSGQEKGCVSLKP